MMVKNSNNSFRTYLFCLCEAIASSAKALYKT